MLKKIRVNIVIIEFIIKLLKLKGILKILDMLILGRYLMVFFIVWLGMLLENCWGIVRLDLVLVEFFCILSVN